jgi:signal transduction histidine kinase
MHYNISIEDLIPLFTIGAVLIASIYHTILYFFSKLQLVGRYSLYLWAALSYLLLAVSTVPEKTFKVPSLPYLISSGVFWLSLLLYLNFLLLVLNLTKSKETTFFKIIKRTYLITPVYFILRFPYFFFPLKYVETIKACGFIMDTYLFFVFIYMVYLMVINKKRDYFKYVVTGSALMIFFNLFTSITYYTQGYFFGLSHVSFIALGYFSDIIFFSLVVSLEMRQNIADKYLALAEISKKELDLALERKKAADILLTHDFEIHNERAKAIIEQRTLIGRKLHDDLSGSLVALRYLAQDFKTKTESIKEKKRFESLEAEISNIYKDTRNYSHELSINAEISDHKLPYDILAYLKKIGEQFSAIGMLEIHTALSEKDIKQKLNIAQTKQVYFLLKDCIENTIKHTGARNIWISLQFDKNECIIHFIDDGKSLNITKKQDFGISSLRGRTNDLNGIFEIKSDIEGTTIIIRFNMSNSFNF